MTNKQKTQIAAELSKLKSIMVDTGNTNLMQRLEDSESKKALLDEIDFAVKNLQAQINRLSPSVPEQIVQNLLVKKQGFHFNLNPSGEQTTKRFDFSVIARRTMQLLKGKD